MPAPSIAVVIPVFNRERLILDALKSVAEQSLSPRSLVVIDDGSTDGTGQAVESFLSGTRLTFPARLIRQANAGVGAARRRAVEESEPSDLLAMLDSDDLWPRAYLERMAAAMSSDPMLVGVSCDRVAVDTASGVRTHKPSSHLTGRATRAIFCRGTSPSSATVIRVAAYHKAGGYDTRMRYKDDADLYLRVSLLGTWAYVPGLTVTLRRNTAATHGGPAHLTQKSIPNRLEMVTMLERLIHERGGSDVIPSRVWRPHLARLWFRLGRDYRSAGDDREAAHCFRRATSIQPIHLRAWLARFRTRSHWDHTGDNQTSQ